MRRSSRIEASHLPLPSLSLKVSPKFPSNGEVVLMSGRLDRCTSGWETVVGGSG